MDSSCRTDLPDDELEEIINSLPLPSQPKTAVTEPAQVASAPGGATTTSTDRRLKTLEKKLKQIEEIKKKQASGEKLEKNQVCAQKCSVMVLVCLFGLISLWVFFLLL